jgi:hypothetical protein
MEDPQSSEWIVEDEAEVVQSESAAEVADDDDDVEAHTWRAQS